MWASFAKLTQKDLILYLKIKARKAHNRIRAYLFTSHLTVVMTATILKPFFQDIEHSAFIFEIIPRKD